MIWQHLYESIRAQAPRDVPEVMAYVHAKRAIREFAQRTLYFEKSDKISTDGTSIQYMPPLDMISAFSLASPSGLEVPYVPPHFIPSFDGKAIWHIDLGKVVIANVSSGELYPVAPSTYTIRYAHYPPDWPRDYNTEVPIPEEFIDGIVSRVLEMLTTGLPQVQAYHHAKWRDYIKEAIKARNQRYEVRNRRQAFSWSGRT